MTIIPIVIGFLFLAGCKTATVNEQQVTYPAETLPDSVEFYSNQLADRLTKNFDYPNPRVVFGYFVLEGNETNFLGERVYEILSDYFSQKYGRSVFICDRRKMNEILAELKLQHSSLFDDNTIAEIGKFVGANLMVTGKISRLGLNRVSLSAQITEIKTMINLSFVTTPFFSVPGDYLDRLEIIPLKNLDLTIPFEYLTSGYDPYLKHIYRGDLFLERGKYQQALFEFEMAIRNHQTPFLGYLGKSAVRVSILRAMVEEAEKTLKGMSLNEKKVVNVFQQEILTNIEKASDLLDKGQVPLPQQYEGRLYLNRIMDINANVQKRLFAFYK